MTFTPPGDETNEPPATAPPAPPVPGWWLASDGNWYPPQEAPAQAPPAPYGAPSYGAPGAPPYGAPGAPYAYSPYGPRPGTNGLAIASLVLGIVWVYWIGSVLAVIFGAIALNQIKERGQQGRGMAIAGLTLGLIGIGFLILVIIVAATAADNASIRFSSIGR